MDFFLTIMEYTSTSARLLLFWGSVWKRRVLSLCCIHTPFSSWRKGKKMQWMQEFLCAYDYIMHDYEHCKLQTAHSHIKRENKCERIKWITYTRATATGWALQIEKIALKWKWKIHMKYNHEHVHTLYKYSIYIQWQWMYKRMNFYSLLHISLHTFIKIVIVIIIRIYIYFILIHLVSSVLYYGWWFAYSRFIAILTRHRAFCLRSFDRVPFFIFIIIIITICKSIM